MAESIPIACSLDAESYVIRLAVIRAIGGMLIRCHLLPDGTGADLYFPDGEDIHRRLRQVIAAEARCCEFLEMRLEAADGALKLSISGPADAELVVRELVRSFESGLTPRRGGERLPNSRA